MNQKFLKLDDSKKERIFKAICEEFTAYTYEDASTNRIVEKAGISKGTLFNYFGCKEGMHNAVLDYAWEFFQAQGIHDFKTNDFIERCHLIAQDKLKIYKKAPYIMDFLVNLHLSDCPQIPSDIKNKIEKMMVKSTKRLYANVDTSLFRHDINPESLMRLIRYTFDGYLAEITNRMKIESFKPEMFDSFVEDHNNLLIEMKKLYYRKEIMSHAK